jgi:hypothetical protein
MKKILSSSLLIAALAVAFTGCLKDKGFDNHTYGINDPDTQPPGVGFPKAAAAKNTVGLDAFTTTTQVVNGLIFVNLESGTPAKSDVHIVLALDDAIRTAYNTANGTSILALNPALFTVGSLNLTIPAGGTNVQVPLNILNTSTLNPNLTYGVGIKIVSADGGYLVASNLKNLFVEFVIKNKYDGVYNLKGFHNRPGLDAPYNETVHMITSGANAISMYWPALGAYAHPLNGGATYYGSFTATFYFDPSTNAILSWDWAPWATTLPVAMGPATDNRYDPATKTIYAQFYYNNNPGARRFTDTLKYIGPRP